MGDVQSIGRWNPQGAPVSLGFVTSFVLGFGAWDWSGGLVGGQRAEESRDTGAMRPVHVEHVVKRHVRDQVAAHHHHVRLSMSDTTRRPMKIVVKTVENPLTTYWSVRAKLEINSLKSGINYYIGRHIESLKSYTQVQIRRTCPISTISTK